MKTKSNQHGPDGERKPPLENNDILSDNERRILKQLIEKPGLTSYKDVQRSLAEQPGEKIAYETVRDEDVPFIVEGW